MMELDDKALGAVAWRWRWYVGQMWTVVTTNPATWPEPPTFVEPLYLSPQAGVGQKGVVTERLTLEQKSDINERFLKLWEEGKKSGKHGYYETIFVAMHKAYREHALSTPAPPVLEEGKWQDIASVRKAALEEAARVADNWLKANGPMGPAHNAGMRHAAEFIASDIRALLTAPVLP